MSDIKTWANTAAANNIAGPPDYWQEGQTGATLNDCGREMQAAIKRDYEDGEFHDLSYGATVTRISDTQIQVVMSPAADLTGYFTADRRIRIDDATSSYYGFVDSSSYSSPDNTVNVTMDGGTVPTTPTAALLSVGKTLSRAAYTALGTAAADVPTNQQITDAVNGIPNPNLLVNGDAAVAQLGTTFSDPAGSVTLDGVRASVQTGDGGAGTVSQEAFAAGSTSVSQECRSYLKLSVTTAPASLLPYVEFRRENVRTGAAQTLTFSFWAQFSVAHSAIVSGVQHFGTGGSADVSVAGSALSVTATWAKYTVSMSFPGISGKTIGTGGDDYISVKVQLPTGALYDFSCTQWKLEEGSTATPYVIEEPETRLARCQRFIAKSYDPATDPGTAAAWNGAMGDVAPGTVSNSISVSVRFPVQMVKTPTVTVYSPQTGTAANLSDEVGPTDVAGAARHVGSAGCIVSNTATVTSGRFYGFHYQADASL